MEVGAFALNELILGTCSRLCTNKSRIHKIIAVSYRTVVNCISILVGAPSIPHLHMEGSEPSVDIAISRCLSELIIAMYSEVHHHIFRRRNRVAFSR